MPTTKAKVIKQYELTMNCCEEERSRLKEGEQAIVEVTEDENAGGGVDQEELQGSRLCFYVCFVCCVICGPEL